MALVELDRVARLAEILRGPRLVVLDLLAVIHEHHPDRHDSPVEATVRPAALAGLAGR